MSDLSRMSIPGQMTVKIADAGERFLYYEGQGPASIEQLGIQVTDAKVSRCPRARSARPSLRRAWQLWIHCPIRSFSVLGG